MTEQVGSERLTDAEGHWRPQLTHWQLCTEVILRVEQRGVLEVNGHRVAAKDLCSTSPLPAGALLLHHHLVLAAERQIGGLNGLRFNQKASVLVS